MSGCVVEDKLVSGGSNLHKISYYFQSFIPAVEDNKINSQYANNEYKRIEKHAKIGVGENSVIGERCNEREARIIPITSTATIAENKKSRPDIHLDFVSVVSGGGRSSTPILHGHGRSSTPIPHRRVQP